MKKYLVIGNPIEHSLSPRLHNFWIKKNNINAVYEKKKLELDEIKNIILNVKENKINGINVTVPFKKDVIPYLDKLSLEAQNTQSVNTLLKSRNQVMGLNTDVKGFTSSFTNHVDIEYKEKDILIIGAGGVTSSIISGLILVANKIYITNRTKEKAELLKDQDLTKKIEIIDWGKKPKVCDLVINTTSVGLKKDEDLGLDFKDYENNKDVLFYDIIYNPNETNFLKEAKLRGNKTLNGKKMFLNQAAFAFQKWTGINPQIDEEVIKLLDK